MGSNLMKKFSSHCDKDQFLVQESIDWFALTFAFLHVQLVIDVFFLLLRLFWLIHRLDCFPHLSLCDQPFKDFIVKVEFP